MHEGKSGAGMHESIPGEEAVLGLPSCQSVYYAWNCKTTGMLTGIAKDKIACREGEVSPRSLHFV